MLKNSKEISRLKNEWKKNWKKGIVDIFIFGSAAKGKKFPNDIDICLIFREKADLSIIKKVGAILGERHHISSLTADNFFIDAHSLAKTILLEGISIISGRKFSDAFSLEAKILYSYDLSKEESSKKVRFVYLLRGRAKSEGLVKNWNGEFISNSAFTVPIGRDSDVQEVLSSWKIKYRRVKIMLMR